MAQSPENQKVCRWCRDKNRRIDDVDKKEKILEWLKWARDKADWIDPLTEKKDEILGKSRQLLGLIDDMDL